MVAADPDSAAPVHPGCEHLETSGNRLQEPLVERPVTAGQHGEPVLPSRPDRRVVVEGSTVGEGHDRAGLFHDERPRGNVVREVGADGTLSHPEEIGLERGFSSSTRRPTST